jgi:hypothetical protein
VRSNGWGELHEECNWLYSLPNIIGLLKSKWMRWHGMWHAWKRREMHANFRWEILKERDLLEDMDTDGRMIIKLISKTEWV